MCIRDSDISGTNTRSSSLKEHWAIDSRIDPIGAGSSEYVTVLGNNMQYASYVDQGHRMDKHFVPGLVIDPVSGNLERSPDGSGGIMVGTKTLYVPGAVSYTHLMVAAAVHPQPVAGAGTAVPYQK